MSNSDLSIISMRDYNAKYCLEEQQFPSFATLIPELPKKRKHVPCRKGAKITQKVPLEEEMRSFADHHSKSIWNDLLSFDKHANFIYESAQLLSKILKAYKFKVYIVEQNHLNHCKKTNGTIIASLVEKFPISSNTIVGSVLNTKETMLIEDLQRSPELFEIFNIDVPKDVLSILCVPVCDPNDNCFAVYNFFRNTSQSSFRTKEKEYAIINAGWIGSSIYQTLNNDRFQKLDKIHIDLLNLIEKLLFNKVTTFEFMAELGLQIKQILEAKYVTFYYKIDKTVPLFRVFVENICEEKSNPLMKNLPSTLEELPEIVKNVYLTGETVVVQSSTDSRFGDHDRHKFAAYVKNLILHPIRNLYETIGILGIINKKIKGLNTSEETYLRIIEEYSFLFFSFVELSEMVKTNTQTVKKHGRMLVNNMTPCSHYCYQETKFIPANFNSLNWYMLIPFEQKYIVQWIHYMIKDLIGDFVKEEKIFEFIITVRSGYRDLPYHNFEHAFNATHCIYTIIKRNPKYFNDAEKIGLLLGSLCHDLGHFGLTNNFLILTNQKYAILYDDESPLENHHFFMYKMILDNLDIFHDITDGFYKKIMEEGEKMILATDLSNYLQMKKANWNLMMNSYDPDNKLHKKYMKMYLSVASDLSGCAKRFRISKLLAENLLIEFYEEGDCLKAMGRKPLALMDRENYESVPEEQVHFLDVVVIPCMKVLAVAFPNCDDLLHGCIATRAKWIAVYERGEDFWRRNSTRLLVVRQYIKD